MIRFSNIKDLWREVNLDLYHQGEDTIACQDTYSIGSSFGKEPRSTREKLAQTYYLTRPRNRILVSNVKPINYSYLLANFLFLFVKEKTIDFIDFYNSKGRMFTDDGRTLNAPLGYRVFNKANQLERIRNILKNDISSRRAVIQILESTDLSGKTRDVPCVNNIQLLVRNSQLHMIVNMRSQSALTLLPYDIFLFTMFHEAIACYLRIELGEYIHFSNSIHFYQNELKKVEELIENRDATYHEMQPMESFNLKIIDELFLCETRARKMIMAQERIDDSFYDEFNLDSYWKNFMKSLITSYGKKDIDSINPIIFQKSRQMTLAKVYDKASS